ncbi:FAS1-like dehydratase domain-containing protein [Martelella limonii]|uniref:FAS1-like dehydratase domain-containing protein n=1 Tax=Martelella limonii TaxID=1647649 RepID=UPI0015802F3F|nr:MaoC family dehydratase N-terminal domain-containing protein [Martelella limonii]
MSEALDLDHLRRWIGRQEQAFELLTPTLVARLNATLDREDPTDEGAEAPLLIHHCLCQPTTPTASLGPDGHPERGDFLPPVPLPRRMWAGGALTFHAPLLIGETISRRSVVEDVTLKEGRSGRLCFVTVTHHLESGGRKALTERQDIVYRDPANLAPASQSPANAAPVKALAARTPQPADAGEHQRIVTTPAARLFRYSALTFNSHRIHYDAPYVTDVEGYPGLVVHGPLQAMLLVQYAADLRQERPARFSFRSLSPAFGDRSLAVNARSTDNGFDLWTAEPGGPVAMEARAEW